MSKTSFQYQVLKQGGDLTKVDVPYPVPGPNEIAVRPRAVGLNPLDWKRRGFGVLVQSWPVVLGLDASGIVDAVGESVSGFKKGDEVIVLCGTVNRVAAYQEVITVPSHNVAHKPASLTFEQAAALPICFLTSVTSITLGLHVPLPFLEPNGSSSLKSILILGGSSSVGAGAIQLLRLALPSAIILTTSSAQHHAHLLSLGATKAFERSAQDDPSAIKAATPDGSGVDAILDTVQAAAGQSAVFNALNPSGPKLYSQVITGQNVNVPEGVNSTLIESRDIYGTPLGPKVIPSVTELLESRKFKSPNRVEVVGKGYDSIDQGLQKLAKGISGAKYVVSL